jgi:hypothetical protein
MAVAIFGSLDGIAVQCFMFDAIVSIIGLMLLVVGIPVCFYWQLRFLVVIYNYSRWWFFGCLFVPFVDCAFVLLHFKISRKPVGLSWLGLLLTGLGCWMAKVDWFS